MVSLLRPRWLPSTRRNFFGAAVQSAVGISYSRLRYRRAASRKELRQTHFRRDEIRVAGHGEKYGRKGTPVF
uniref:Uncharacterized protein n=1 Tax=Aromatoleum buckelii TaxID=200254 RepID=A0ABX1N091_9RHOO